MAALDDIEAALSNQPRKPPIDKWNPALSGDIDIHIDSRGDWYHEGTRIQRHQLVKLFASILRREQDGQHYLVTPVEKWRIRVDDAPLRAVDFESVCRDGAKHFWFRLNTDELVALDADHRLQVAANAGGAAQPYLTLDHGLTAKLTTAVFYRLVNGAEQRGGEIGIESGGVWFSLGTI